MSIKIQIDPEQVKALAKLGATVKEIADFFHCSDTTINNRFMPELIEGRAALKISLRRAQIRLAIEKDNPTMQIWLGKQILGQTDSRDLNISSEAKITVDSQMERELLAKLADRTTKMLTTTDDPMPTAIDEPKARWMGREATHIEAKLLD